MSRLLVFGAGGHGCVVAETAVRSGSWTEVVHLDDSLDRPQLEIGTEVLGSFSDIDSIARCDDRFVVGVGENSVRLRLHESFSNLYSSTSVISFDAVVSANASISTGSVVMPRVVVNAGAVIGSACILNTGSIVEHGVTLSAGVHVCPGAILGGDARIGARTLIGLGATVLPGVSVSSDVILGAGAVAVSNIENPGTYVGVPAKVVVTH